MLDRTTAPAIKDAVDFDLRLQPYDFFTLDNKVPVYMVNAGAEDVIQIELIFFAGNWYEQQKIIAATTNYLLKNGTKHKSAFEINEQVEFYGAFLSRACFNENATVTLHCLSKHLQHLLPIIKELITASVFDENELNIYKQNQKQRLAVSLKKCDFVANRLIEAAIYGEQHPYGVYTNDYDYDTLQQEQLKIFFNKYYLQGKCLILASGKLPADIAEQLNNNFGSLSLNAHELPALHHVMQPLSNTQQVVINDATGIQGAVRLATGFPNRHHPDFVKAQVLNNVFGGYFGSRLMTNIREDKGYTYGIHSFIQNHLQSTSWMISTEAGRDVCEATIKEVHKEMKILRDKLISENELLLVKNYMMGSLLGDLDGPFQIMARWKNYILNNLPTNYFYETLQTIRSITPQQLQEIANKYLLPENFYHLTVI